MRLIGAFPNPNVCLTIFPHFERDQPLFIFSVALTFETILIWIKPYFFLNLETISDQEIYNFIVLDTRGKKGRVEGPCAVFGPQQIKFRWPVFRGGECNLFASPGQCFVIFSLCFPISNPYFSVCAKITSYLFLLNVIIARVLNIRC